ncbi:MAG: carboxyl transferase domain-containing protein [Actinomycetota bacterium]|nr:carboxyl transferase domain-containing protein [Actinomycetota bacterium]
MNGKKEEWESVLTTRHPDRPTARDYMGLSCDYFLELRGDRCGGDDPSIVAGLARIAGHRFSLVAHDRGKGSAGRCRCNFGMTHPQGFRKARRIFSLAEKLLLPLVCMVDTPGAFPGLEAEEGGQAWAISRNLAMLTSLRVPILVVFIGEGGSGGALALGVGDAVLMLENACFSVISPEGCASILWRDASRAPQAASMLRMTPRELVALGLADDIIEEMPQGAHGDPKFTALLLRQAIIEHLNVLKAVPIPALIDRRRRRYRGLGFFTEKTGEKDELGAGARN